MKRLLDVWMATHGRETAGHWGARDERWLDDMRVALSVMVRDGAAPCQSGER
jgi:hypothetical protein